MVAECAYGSCQTSKKTCMKTCLIALLIWVIVRTTFYIILSCLLLSKGFVGWGLLVMLAQVVDLGMYVVEDAFYAKVP